MDSLKIVFLFEMIFPSIKGNFVIQNLFLCPMIIVFHRLRTRNKEFCLFLLYYILLRLLRNIKIVNLLHFGNDLTIEPKLPWWDSSSYDQWSF